MSEEKSSTDEGDRSSQTEAVNNPVNPQPSDRPKVQDRFELFLRYGSPFVTALTIALIGWLSSNYAHEAQVQETARNETAQNYRLYTELLSKREDAESALRRDMFMTILEKFFQVTTPEDGEADMGKQLLKLEMLSLNFGESLSLSPLFVATDHAIDKFTNSTDAMIRGRGRKHRKKLHGLAKRVADQQLSALSAGGKIRKFYVPISAFSSQNEKQGDKENYIYPDHDSEVEGDFVWKLEGITRTYQFTFSDPEITYSSIHVVIDLVEEAEEEKEPVQRKFDLDYFNFPMIDNTRLSSDQRFALILTDWKKTYLEVTAIVFPGKYSGQRDKPFLDDVIHRLQDKGLKSSEDTNCEDRKNSSMEGAGSTEKKEECK